jgi:hypothetical protein
MGKKPVRTDEAEKEFYEWVGRCMKQWAKIEFYLFDICSMAISSNYRNVAAVIYWRQPGIDTRLTTITDLLNIRLPPTKGRNRVIENPEIARWNKLRIRMKEKLAPFRNFVAHQPAWHRFNVVDTPDGAKFTEFWHTTQNHRDAERRPSEIKDPGVADMKAHCEKMDTLVAELRQLAEDLEPLLVKLPLKRGKQ